MHARLQIKRCTEYPVINHHVCSGYYQSIRSQKAYAIRANYIPTLAAERDTQLFTARIDMDHMEGTYLI